MRSVGLPRVVPGDGAPVDLVARDAGAGFRVPGDRCLRSDALSVDE